MKCKVRYVLVNESSSRLLHHLSFKARLSHGRTDSKFNIKSTFLLRENTSLLAVYPAPKPWSASDSEPETNGRVLVRPASSFEGQRNEGLSAIRAVADEVRLSTAVVLERIRDACDLSIVTSRCRSRAFDVKLNEGER